MSNLAGKASAAGSVSPCFYPDDEPAELSHRDGNVNACFYPDDEPGGSHPCFYPDDEPVELSHRDPNVNACFHPDDGDVNSCFHPDLHLSPTGMEERQLAALAAR